MVTPDDHPQCGVPQKNKNEHKYNDSGNLSSAIASNNGEDKDDVMSLPYKTEDDALRSSSSLWAPNPGTGLRSFPYQLHRMLDDAEFKGFEHVVSWQDRKSFKVHDRHLFATKILPIYFEGQTQYKSFQRQRKYITGSRTVPSYNSSTLFPSSSPNSKSYLSFRLFHLFLVRVFKSV